MLRAMKAREESRVAEAAPVWHLYVLRCGDGSYYTGVTTDIERRLGEHQAGKASRYTRAHRPVELVHREACGTRAQALSRECAVKSLSRAAKEALVGGEGRPKGTSRPRPPRRGARAKAPARGEKA
jgi:putative endonuclease